MGQNGTTPPVGTGKTLNPSSRKTHRYECSIYFDIGDYNFTAKLYIDAVSFPELLKTIYEYKKILKASRMRIESIIEVLVE